MRIIDMHCDTISELLKKKRAGQAECLLHNSGHVDLERMQKSGYLLQNFAMFVNLGDCEEPWQEVCKLYQLYQEEMCLNQNRIQPVLCYSDIAKNEAAGKLSALLTVEEGGVCGGEIEKLRALYHMGVRMLTLTWNYPNELGYPNKQEGALTEMGRAFVYEMERLGMIVDVSHLSDAGFYDVLSQAKKPFVASHSNARAICPSARNLSDDMIRGLSHAGGCMGLNFYAHFLRMVPQGEKNPGTIRDVVLHAKHIVKVGGIEVLGIGSDFDGIDTHEELPGVQSMELLWDALHCAGFTQGQLDKIFWGNVLRVYRDALPNQFIPTCGRPHTDPLWFEKHSQVDRR